jgi:hypothetical protein
VPTWLCLQKEEANKNGPLILKMSSGRTVKVLQLLLIVRYTKGGVQTHGENGVE